MDLAESIFKTLAFFDAQNLALTLAEIKNYLFNFSFDLSRPPATLPRPGEGLGERSLTLLKLKTALEIELKDKVGYAQGFYFLEGREELAGLRQEYYREALARLRQAKKVLYFLRFLPYLRAVAISGSVALLGAREDSDIDLLILTAPNRIWLARLLVSGFFQILGQRRHGRHTKNRFCLNHYLAPGEPIEQDKNLYTAVEYASLLPVLGRAEIKKFWQANDWIKEYLPQRVSEEERMPFFDFSPSFIAKALELIFDVSLAPLLNWLAGLYQKSRIELRENIIVSDRELSFHPDSRGQQILERFRAWLTKA